LTRVNIEVENELHRKAKLASLLENKTLIEFINEAINEKVEKNKKVK
jgi:predicted HicB family RNase H-like nuclease